MNKLSLALALLLSPLTAFAADSPATLLEKADAIRNPSDSYFMHVDVATEGEDAGDSQFDVAIDGDRTLVRTLAPERDRGRNLLMIGEEMWAFVPNLKRAVRIALNQKLTGQAANGDISRMRWAGDYDATVDPSAPTEPGQTVLLLKANKKGLTYDGVRVWLDSATARPLHADFLTPAGMLLKHATYTGYGMLAGSTRPQQIVIQDAVRPAERSTIHILSMENRKFPAAMFTQSELDR